MNEQDKLITKLSSGLAPVAPVPNVSSMGLAWFVLSAVYVVAVTGLFGGVRPGVLSQLATEPRFLLETLLGVAAILWTALMAFRGAIPAALSRSFALAGLVLMVLWLVQYPIGLIAPALEPSELGARGHCFFETMVYSLPPILAGLYLVRRLYPLQWIRTAMALSLAAAMLPALYMQLACMYDPSHILGFHILPALLMVAAVTVIVAVRAR